MAWQHGEATVIRMTREGVVVQCPFCGKEHLHSRLSLGSKEVVAGCHKGFTRCRTYSIPRRRARV